MVCKPSVLGKEGAVQVGTDQVTPPHALQSVLAVVAEALEDAPERLGAGAEVGPPAMVLEAGHDPRFTAGLVVGPGRLSPAADGEHDGAAGGRLGERLALARDHVGRDRPLVAVL